MAEVAILKKVSKLPTIADMQRETMVGLDRAPSRSSALFRRYSAASNVTSSNCQREHSMEYHDSTVSLIQSEHAEGSSLFENNFGSKLTLTIENNLGSKLTLTIKHVN